MTAGAPLTPLPMLQDTVLPEINSGQTVLGGSLGKRNFELYLSY